MPSPPSLLDLSHLLDLLDLFDLLSPTLVPALLHYPHTRPQLPPYLAHLYLLAPVRAVPSPTSLLDLLHLLDLAHLLDLLDLLLRY